MKKSMTKTLNRFYPRLIETPNVWIVETEAPDRHVVTRIFSGPMAEQLAREFCELNKQFTQ